MSELQPTVPDLPPALAALRDRTPARIFVGRAGEAYRTRTWLELRADHAFARDAVEREIDLDADFSPEFQNRFALFEVSTRATSKHEYLLRPDLGRSLDPAARRQILELCPAGPDIQIVIGDGLSALAVRAQVPTLLPELDTLCRAHGWRLGRPFFIRHCRVGVLNDVGELLDPAVVVLLIGERPGLATAESLSAYMAFRPRPGHDDARRNLISNIHAQGVSIPEAAQRIVALAAQLMRLGTSGISVKETPNAPALSRPTPPEAKQ